MEGEVNFRRKEEPQAPSSSRATQRVKLKQIVVACATKLQEKEATIEQVSLTMTQ